jgi:penicillin-binding protein-related factor A (putative recombinase)
MTGKEFEKLIQLQMDAEERRGNATMSRYGVHAVFIDGKWTPINSLPDFEGVLRGGRQFVFDAKVCSSRASLPLNESKVTERQLRHLLKRARFGAVTFLLIHFPERVLKTKTTPAETFAFPVYPESEFWLRVESGEIKSICREDCHVLAASVEWIEGRGRPRPDLLPAIMELAGETQPAQVIQTDPPY